MHKQSEKVTKKQNDGKIIFALKRFQFFTKYICVNTSKTLNSL